MACFVAAGFTGWAWAWLAGWFLGLQVFKVLTYVLGLREGLQFIHYLKRWNLIKWAATIKLINAVLLVAFLALLWRDADGWGMFALASAVLMAAGYALSRVPALRELLVVLFLAIYVVLPWASGFFS